MQGFLLLGGEEDAQGVDWTDEILRFVPGTEEWQLMAQVRRIFKLPYFVKININIKPSLETSSTDRPGQGSEGRPSHQRLLLML